MKPFIEYNHKKRQVQMPSQDTSVQPPTSSQIVIPQSVQLTNSIDNHSYIFSCPHCELFIEVKENEVNCCIFRHAYLFQKTDDGNIILTSQLNPHASKEMCDSLKAEGKIYGCGGPFRIIRDDNGYRVEKCDHI